METYLLGHVLRLLFDYAVKFSDCLLMSFQCFVLVLRCNLLGRNLGFQFGVLSFEVFNFFNLSVLCGDAVAEAIVFDGQISHLLGGNFLLLGWRLDFL